MTQSNEPTIEQMNEAIAQFMGGERVLHPDNKYFHEDHYGYVCHKGCWWNENNLKYHISWDWLMPVVEKIEKDFYNENELIIYSTSCYINKWNANTNKYDSFISGVGKKIDAVYAAVYQFIQWYNQQKQNDGTSNG